MFEKLLVVMLSTATIVYLLMKRVVSENFSIVILAIESLYTVFFDVDLYHICVGYPGFGV